MVLSHRIPPLLCLSLLACNAPPEPWVDVEFGEPIRRSTPEPEGPDNRKYSYLDMGFGELHLGGGFARPRHKVEVPTPPSLSGFHPQAAALIYPEKTSGIIWGIEPESKLNLLLQVTIDWIDESWELTTPTILYQGDDFQQVTSISHLPANPSALVVWDFGRHTLFRFEPGVSLTPITSADVFPQIVDHEFMCAYDNPKTDGGSVLIVEFTKHPIIGAMCGMHNGIVLIDWSGDGVITHPEPNYD